MSDAVTSFGIILGVSDTNGGTYTPVAELRDVEPPDLNANLFDVSTHRTPGPDVFEEMLPGAMKRANEMSFKVNYLMNNATHDEDTGLLAIHLNRTKKHFEMQYPAAAGGKKWRFAGYVVGFKPSGAVDGELTAMIRVKPVDYMTVT